MPTYALKGQGLHLAQGIALRFISNVISSALKGHKHHHRKAFAPMGRRPSIIIPKAMPRAMGLLGLQRAFVSFVPSFCLPSISLASPILLPF